MIPKDMPCDKNKTAFLYYCTKCKAITYRHEDNQRIDCPTCGAPMKRPEGLQEKEMEKEY